MRLGVLEINSGIVTITKERDSIETFTDTLTAIRKLNDFQLGIPINKSIAPVAQLIRRQLYNKKEIQ